MKLLIKDVTGVLSNTFRCFSDDKVLKLSGSLAYSTIFSLGPLLIVIIAVCSLFLGREAVEGNIYYELQQFLGTDSAMQLQEIIKKAAISGKNTLAAVVGGVTLFIGATSIFNEIQDSINDIWGLKPKPKKNWLKMIQNRFLSFSVIISLGFLLLVSLTITALVAALYKHLQSYFSGALVSFFSIFNELSSLVIVASIFAVIFKVLPDAIIRWKDVAVGAIITALLFMAGKYAISFYISKSNVGSTFGAAGALIILLLWVYYSSVILYLGAEFTKSYAIKYGSEIRPSQYAVSKKQVEIELGKKSVQQVDETVPNKIKKPG